MKKISEDEKYDFIIGIDIGTNTGLAAYSREEGKLITCETVDIISAMETVFILQQVGSTLVRLEDVKGWKPFKGTPRDFKKLAGAGSIKRDQTIWETFLKKNHIDFELVGLTQCRKKVPADTFKMITGWQGKTNEHNRDAGLICYGVTRYLQTNLK